MGKTALNTYTRERAPVPYLCIKVEALRRRRRKRQEGRREEVPDLAAMRYMEVALQIQQAGRSTQRATPNIQEWQRKYRRNSDLHPLSSIRGSARGKGVEMAVCAMLGGRKQTRNFARIRRVKWRRSISRIQTSGRQATEGSPRRGEAKHEVMDL